MRIKLLTYKTQYSLLSSTPLSRLHKIYNVNTITVRQRNENTSSLGPMLITKVIK